MTEAPPGGHAWDRFHAVWDLVAVAAPVITGALVWADDALTMRARLLASLLLCVFLLWYWRFGAHAVRRPGGRRGIVQLAGALVLFAGLIMLTMAAALLMSVVFLHLFLFLERWRARLIVLGILAVLLMAAMFVHFGLSASTAVALLPTVIFPVLSAGLLGAYISAVISQSRDRSELIAELTETRSALARERHTAGMTAERERLSVEIHDTLAQGFTSILMLTQSARLTLERAAAPVPDQLDLIERTARENLAEARSLVAALCPPDLSAHNLTEALARLAERHTRDTGVPVDVESDDAPGGGTPERDVVFLRAAQEALANIRRHAKASSVRIVFSPGALTVSDDGQGFAPGRGHGGYGLSGLRSRVIGLGGTCTVVSAPGAGTTVHVELPMLSPALTVPPDAP
ncbi:histidine kinase [Dactylosporangium siamense]|uniref:Oxygen sensor histidine kinase NreB n=1 Tax=Dactylosporangium siamense TaxID=685454 RepID=A0A919PY67_9ACTN|nr:sensor histidine kinase [Dactylosporangium siamense]GIG52537.1 two-component sensor histidine kinase [Dactylosporangium siamense]